MKTLRFLFPFFIICFFNFNIAFAQMDFSGFMTSFMTSRDILRDTPSSNINLYNSRNQNMTVYGLYVRQYDYVVAGESCATSMPIYSGNVTAGAFVVPVVIDAGKSVAIGSNYLYNMILQAIYYENNIIPSAPPGCALPGCTWGSDSVKYNWCIYLGVLAPVSNSSNYTSNVPPSADVASGMGYNYNAISSYAYLGPISCDDQALSCAVTTQQTQSLS